VNTPFSLPRAPCHFRISGHTFWLIFGPVFSNSNPFLSRSSTCITKFCGRCNFCGTIQQLGSRHCSRNILFRSADYLSALKFLTPTFGRVRQDFHAVVRPSSRDFKPIYHDQHWGQLCKLITSTLV